MSASCAAAHPDGAAFHGPCPKPEWLAGRAGTGACGLTGVPLRRKVVTVTTFFGAGPGRVPAAGRLGVPSGARRPLRPVGAGFSLELRSPELRLPRCGVCFPGAGESAQKKEESLVAGELASQRLTVCRLRWDLPDQEKRMLVGLWPALREGKVRAGADPDRVVWVSAATLARQ